MDIKNMELSLDAQEALAFGGSPIGVDGQISAPKCAADLAALPEIVDGGVVAQTSGLDQLRAKLEAAAKHGCDVDPGYKIECPYEEVLFNDGFGEAKRVLRYRLAWYRGNQTFNPKWEREEVETPKSRGKDKGEALIPAVVFKTVDGAPYVHHKLRRLTVESLDGLIQLDHPDMPPKVVDEFEARTDDLRVVPLRLAPDADHKVLSSFGIHVDQMGMGRWSEIKKAQAGAHAHLRVTYNTPGKGWMRFPGCDAPHYVYGNKVVAPEGGPELHASARGGTGAAPAMGVQTNGTFEAWRLAMRLVLQNPDMATILGFSTSSALLARIKEMEAGILHMVGGSSRGKSTALKVAASFIGSAEGPREANAYVQSWNSTENAMEAPLEARSDSPSLYDELYELPQNVDVLALLYRVANGRGKQRMTKEIEARLVKVWKTQILSTGEGSFASRIAQDGHEYFPGGLQFRVMELHIETIPFWGHVEVEGAKPDHGAYRDLVEAARASAPTPQGRIIEAIELTLKRNHGHFWDRWIARLQDAAGVGAAERWFEEERSALDPLIPPGANPVYIRRTKHVAAAMAGLRGILEICDFGAEFDEEVLTSARAWSRDHLWSAGINIMGGEGTDLYERFRDWLLAHESDLLRPSEPYGPSRPTIGWTEVDGGCAMPVAEFRRVATTLKIDAGRLEKSISSNGWEKARKRHPRAGRDSAPQWVWRAKGVFKGKISAQEDPPTAEEVWGAS